MRGAARRPGGAGPDRTGAVLPAAYVGHRGWLGVRLDGDVDWDELAAVCTDAYRAVAPKKLVALLDAD